MTVKKYADDYDKGYTQLFGGESISKSSVLVEAYGTVDELNSIIGLARSQIKDKEISEMLHKLQRDLFNLGSDFASPITDEKTNEYVPRISEADIKWIEECIEKIDKSLPPLRNFILPGGSYSASLIHVARAICRRAERRAVSLKGEKGVNQVILKYLNRLSDFLFYLARWVNQKENVQDEVWVLNKC